MPPAQQLTNPPSHHPTILLSCHPASPGPPVIPLIPDTSILWLLHPFSAFLHLLPLLIKAAKGKFSLP